MSGIWAAFFWVILSFYVVSIGVFGGISWWLIWLGGSKMTLPECPDI